MMRVVAEHFKNSDCYTLAHIPGKVLGPIEQRKISSTFLSKKVECKDNLYKYSMVLPTFAKKLFIPCSVDTIFNVSDGLSHGFTRCEGTKQITYLFDLYHDAKEIKSLGERFFKAYLSSWSLKKLKFADELWVPHQEIKTKVEKFHNNVKVVDPFFLIEDFPLLNIDKSKRTYVVINPKSLKKNEIKSIVKYLNEKRIDFKFAGEEKNIEFLKDSMEQKYFFGDPCSGEYAPLLAGALCVIDFSESILPEYSLQSISSGAMVLTKKRSTNFYMPEESFIEFDSIDDMLSNFEKVFTHKFDEKSAHQFLFKYKKGKFINRLKSL